MRLERVEQGLADIIVHFRKHVGVDDFGQRLDQAFALVAGGEFDQVGDIGGVERLDQLAGGGVVPGLDRIEHPLDELGPQPVLGIHHRFAVPLVSSLPASCDCLSASSWPPNGLTAR